MRLVRPAPPGPRLALPIASRPHWQSLSGPVSIRTARRNSRWLPGPCAAWWPASPPTATLPARNVDRRLAEALLQLEARLDEMDRRLRVSAGGLDQPGSVPAQLAAMEEWTLDRLSRLDARLLQLNGGLAERPDRLAQTVEPSGG